MRIGVRARFVRGAMPLVAVTTVALPPADCTSRGSQPSRPRPLTNDEPAGGDLLRVRRRGLVDMRIAVWTDQRRHIDPVAADIADEIARIEKLATT